MPPTEREPFGAGIPKQAKRSAGRTAAPVTPLNIRTTGVDIGEETAAHVGEKLGKRLSKFALHIERVTVRFEDVNGPRGGVDTRCRIKATLSGLPSVVVEEQELDALRAFEAAARGITRALREELAKATVASRRGPPPA